LTKVRNILATALIATGLLLPLNAGAQPAAYVTDKDIEVAVRTFSFIYGMPKGDITIEIVYDPDNSASLTEANQLKKIIGAGDEFANRLVRAKMVPLAQMGSTKSRIAYVTHGLQPHYDVLLEKARSNKMLTFSTDFQCVGSQKCVMGVEADPGIKIEISRAATAASELEFSQALKLMIREVE
jgi:hypothetical protein